MPSASRTSAFARVTALAGKRPTHAAFAWLHGNPKTIMDWQMEVVAIPAPPFGEQARAKWLAGQFVDAGLSDVLTDDIGNVLGFLYPGSYDVESTGHIVVVSAHLDTVFPAGTLIQPSLTRKDDADRLEAPGA